MMNFKFYGKDSNNNIYLDNGASTLPLLDVLNKGLSFMRTYGSVHRGAGFNSDISTQAYEDSRSLILNCLDGTKEDVVIFTANTTDGVNRMAHLIPPKSNILISDIEHTSNSLPWRKMHNVTTFKTINGRINPDNIKLALTNNKNIYMVAITLASNISGYITDIKTIYDICKKHNVLLFADASQYAPHFKPSLKFCDFIVYCGHKMYAPFGSGVLAGRKDILNNSGTSNTGGGNVIYSNNDFLIYKQAPFMHEAGTPNAFGVITMAEAHKILYSNPTILLEHNLEMNKVIENNVPILKDFGYEVFFYKGENKTPIFIINNKQKSNKETVKLLNESLSDKYSKNVFCREGAFCAYPLIEQIRKINSIKNPNQIDTNIIKKNNQEFVVSNNDIALPPNYYSLIRFSAGLINVPEDIIYTVNKLIYINKNI